jgi:hypothetical protein
MHVIKKKIKLIWMTPPVRPLLPVSTPGSGYQQNFLKYLLSFDALSSTSLNQVIWQQTQGKAEFQNDWSYTNFD